MAAPTVRLFVSECSGEADIEVDAVVYQGALDFDEETGDYCNPRATALRAGDVPRDEIVFLSDDEAADDATRWLTRRDYRDIDF